MIIRNQQGHLLGLQLPATVVMLELSNVEL